MKEGMAKDMLLEDAIRAAIESEKDAIFHKRLNTWLILAVWVHIIFDIIFFCMK